MTVLFTPQRRSALYETILAQFKSDDRITGLIALGTTDIAVTDDNVGIDMLVIIEKPSIIDIVFTLWVKRLEDLLRSEILFDFIINEDLNTVSILLNDFLQIYVQFRAVNRFNLVGTDWCVIFDRNGKIQTYLDKRAMTIEQHVQLLYQQQMKGIWNPVVSCVRELRRNNLWKATAELEILRKHIVEIAGLRHLKFTHQYMNMDQLPEMFLIQLRHTLPTTINETAIRRSLKIALGMLFAETSILDAQFQTTYTEQLQSQLSNFVDAYS